VHDESELTSRRPSVALPSIVSFKKSDQTFSGIMDEPVISGFGFHGTQAYEVFASLDDWD
jgi:hypothetical protein